MPYRLATAQNAPYGRKKCAWHFTNRNASWQVHEMPASVKKANQAERLPYNQNKSVLGHHSSFSWHFYSPNETLEGCFRATGEFRMIYSIVAGLGTFCVLFLLPLAGMWRFPGDTPGGWYWCFLLNCALVCFDIYALRQQWNAKLIWRLPIYISLAVTIYIFIVLVQLESARKIEQKLRGGLRVHLNLGMEKRMLEQKY